MYSGYNHMAKRSIDFTNNVRIKKEGIHYKQNKTCKKNNYVIETPVPETLQSKENSLTRFTPNS